MVTALLTTWIIIIENTSVFAKFKNINHSYLNHSRSPLSLLCRRFFFQPRGQLGEKKITSEQRSFMKVTRVFGVEHLFIKCEWSTLGLSYIYGYFLLKQSFMVRRLNVSRMQAWKEALLGSHILSFLFKTGELTKIVSGGCIINNMNHNNRKYVLNMFLPSFKT